MSVMDEGANKHAICTTHKILLTLSIVMIETKCLVSQSLLYYGGVHNWILDKRSRQGYENSTENNFLSLYKPANVPNLFSLTMQYDYGYNISTVQSFL